MFDLFLIKYNKW